jgi:hypothetical protein
VDVAIIFNRGPKDPTKTGTRKFHDMARKKSKLSKGTLFLSLLIAGIIFLLLPQNITKGLNFLFVELFNPILGIGHNSAPEVFRPSTDDFVSRSEHDKLWTAYNNLRADFRTEHDRYEKLAKIRSGLPKAGAALVLAEIINTSISGMRHELIISRGENDGLAVGQYVLVPGENSIIGTISETSKAKARIRLVTDIKHNIKVLIWRESRKDYLEAQMVGNGKNSGTIPFISKEYKIQVGDTVYAAARKEFLETPRVIGEISEVKRDENKPLLWDITVRPICDAETLTDVAVIVANP